MEGLSNIWSNDKEGQRSLAPSTFLNDEDESRVSGDQRGMRTLAIVTCLLREFGPSITIRFAPHSLTFDHARAASKSRRDLERD